MTRIVWTLQAVEDVEAIRAYIARDSPHYAALMVERIVESVERLKEFPRLERVVPEVEREAYREVILRGTYRIVYRLKLGTTFVFPSKEETGREKDRAVLSILRRTLEERQKQ